MWVLHLIVAIVLVINHFNGLSLGASKGSVNTLSSIFYVVVVIQIGVNFVFKNPEEDLSL